MGFKKIIFNTGICGCKTCCKKLGFSEKQLRYVNKTIKGNQFLKFQFLFNLNFEDDPWVRSKRAFIQFVLKAKKEKLELMRLMHLWQ